MAAKLPRSESRYFKVHIRPFLDDSRVEFVGEVDDAAKADFLGNAAALLFPIDWPEPFGLVVIEAMACGTPVIAWRRGSVPEIVDHGVTGLSWRMRRRLSKQLVHSIDWIVKTSDKCLSSDLRPEGWPRNTSTASKLWLVQARTILTTGCCVSSFVSAPRWQLSPRRPIDYKPTLSSAVRLQCPSLSICSSSPYYSHRSMPRLGSLHPSCRN